MYTEIYKEAHVLSKKYKGRKLKDSEKLYKIIEEAVDIAQLRGGVRSDQAMNFLISIFMPHISKISYRIYSKISESTELTDIKQEVKIMFIILVDKYDKTKSTFPYYIGRWLPKYMNKWAKKEKKYIDKTAPLTINEDFLIDPVLDGLDSSLNYLNSKILEKEYISFIEQSAERYSRSQTHKEVCLKYFLSNSSCKEIADELNISYHAVYEVIGKIKDDLQYFFNGNAFTDYSISSTGIKKIGIKGKVSKMKI